MKIALTGCGFWSSFQIAGWREIPGVEVVAVQSRNADRVRAVQERFGITRGYEDLNAMLDEGGFDVLDVCSDVPGHLPAVLAAVEREIPVICQKPMAGTWEECRAMTEACRAKNLWFAVHENWRHQSPFRTIKQLIEEGRIGDLFRVRLSFCCSFPVYENQPALAAAEKFILSDIGSHILDCARFFGGEAESLFAASSRVNDRIKGEDVATVLIRHVGGVQTLCEMSYASRLEREKFPQTHALFEGSKGSISLGRDYELRITDKGGTTSQIAVPKSYPWADPEYLIVHSSIVECLSELTHAFREGCPSETSGEDNLRTMALVHASYLSAESGKSVSLREFEAS